MPSWEEVVFCADLKMTNTPHPIQSKLLTHLTQLLIVINPLAPKSDQFQISPRSLTRNITSHSMENLAFHHAYADERWLY